MNVILQNAIPDEMSGPVVLPGMAPCGAQDWVRVDEAYAAQMAYRTQLLAQRKPQVLWMEDAAAQAADEVLEMALEVLPELGFRIEKQKITRPDGHVVDLDRSRALHTLGHLVQEDLCILQKRGDAHVLTGAVLCFPANWRLSDKAGRDLFAIHDPVAEYDEGIARRVQRLFDGVRAGRPLWRFNRLNYVDADLHQPSGKDESREGTYVRSERQCIVRLPRTDAVVFSIHTYVVRREAWAQAGQSRPPAPT